MDELIERVAKAIYEEFSREGGYVGAYGSGVDADTVLDGGWHLDKIARAAINAVILERTPCQVCGQPVYPNLDKLRPIDIPSQITPDVASS